MEQYVDAIKTLAESLADNINGAILIIVILIAGERTISALTKYRYQQRENKESDAYSLVLSRMDRMQERYEANEQRLLNELDLKQTVIEEQRKIANEQSKTASYQFEAIKEHNRMIAEARQMSKDQTDKILEDLVQQKANLADGVSMAQENNELLKEGKPLWQHQSHVLETLTTKVDTLPMAIAEAFRPSVNELHNIVKSVDTLITEVQQHIKDTAAIERTIEGLRTEFTSACKNLSDRIDALSKAAPSEQEAPTLPSKPEELNGKDTANVTPETKPD